MKNKDKFKELLTFLRKRNAYVSFLYNFNHYREHQTQTIWEVTRRGIFTNNHFYDIKTYIEYAFAWRKTKEGYDYWCDLWVRSQ